MGTWNSSHLVKFLTQCFTSFATMILLLTMPSSTSFGKNLERSFLFFIPSCFGVASLCALLNVYVYSPLVPFLFD